MYSDAELSLIRNTFKDSKALITAIRKVFWSVDLLETDIKSLKTLTREAVQIIKKAFKPELDYDLPLGQTIDLYMTVDFKDKSLEEMERAVKIREVLLDLIDRGLNRLVTLDKEGYNDVVQFHGGNMSEDYIIRLFARNSLVLHTDTCLSNLSLLANQSEDTPEELKKKAKKDSAK